MRLRATSNLQHLGHMTFDSFEIDERASPEVTMAMRDARSLAQDYVVDPEGWLVFMGPYGCGKTHLAAAIANERVARGLTVLFVVVPDLLDHLRATYAPNSPVSYDQRFNEVRNVEMLVLDDLGTQNATPWAVEKLYQLLNDRHVAGLPTVITTNLTPRDMDPRLASRLRDQEVVRTVPIFAADFRAGGKDDSFGSLAMYSGMTFDTFSDRRDELTDGQARQLLMAVGVVRAYAEQPSNWLLLRGGYGVGKTHLAAAAANKAARGGMRVLFVVTSDLLDHLRATYQPGSPVTYDERFNEVRRARLLVLDDLGAKNATSWAQEKLFQILNYRYVGALATVITVSFADWEHLAERLQGRLLDATVCAKVDIDLPSYRGAPERPRHSTRRR